MSQFTKTGRLKRVERARDCSVKDVRVIEGDDYGVDVTVYEADFVNEDGQPRDNIVIIPSILFENTKDVQFRHDDGVVGKYSLCLAQERDDVADALSRALEQRVDKAQQTYAEAKEKQEQANKYLDEL